MQTSALAIINSRRKSYSVPDGEGGSVEVTVGEVLTIDGDQYEVMEPEEIGKLYVKKVD
jgi:hypothetical protein